MPRQFVSSSASDDLYEVIDGQRVVLSPMGIFAAWIAGQIFGPLSHFARTQSVGRAVPEGLFHLPAPINRDRRPDVAFVSYQRWPKSRPLPATDNAWDVVPDLAVEVVSPTDQAEDLQGKIAEYFRAGVTLVWVAYPLQSEVYVYESPTQIRVLTRNDELDGGIVLPDFRLSLAELFAESATNGTPA